MPSPQALLWLTGQLSLAALQFPFGMLLGVVAERFSREPSPYARMRNIAIKYMIAHLSVSLVLWGISSKSGISISLASLMMLVMRVLILAAGTVIGAAFQPVGLTGGIATGKSTVSSLLQSSSENSRAKEDVEFIIIDVDGIAHDVLLPEKLGKDSVYGRLVSEFGTGILAKADEQDSSPPNIDRRKLGDLIFKDNKKRRKLNSITHPKIIKIMLKRIVFEGSQPNFKSKLRVVCVDIPLLFEGGLPMRLLFGTVIVVACNSKLQLERLQKRNPDLTPEQCRQRIASQIPVEEKARKAHFVIRNDGDLKALKSEVGQVKERVGNIVSGPQRGVELWLMVIGLGGLFLNQCTIN